MFRCFTNLVFQYNRLVRISGVTDWPVRADVVQRSVGEDYVRRTAQRGQRAKPLSGYLHGQGEPRLTHGGRSVC